MAKETASVAQQMADLSEMVESSSASVGKNIRILLYGPPKHGKSTLAMTLSELCPDELPAKEMTDLSDGLFIQFDSGGCDSFRALNLSVPFINMSRFTDENALVSGYRNAAAILRQRVTAGVTKWAAVDGMTTFDKMLKTALSARLDKWPLYDAILGHHMKFFQALQALPIDIVFIAHPRGLSEAASDSQAQQRIASSLPGGATICPDITGQALPYYRGQVFGVWPVIATKIGKNAKTEFAVYPNGTQGFEAGTRYPLPDKVPAHLGRLLRQIRNGEVIR